MAHKWAQWLHQPCLLGAPQCVARGENQKWPTSGDSSYITPAFSGIPNAEHGGKNQKEPISRHSGYITPAFSGLTNAQQGENITNSPQVGTMATSPLPSRGSPMPSKGRKSEMAHKWGQGLHYPCLLGDPQCRARGKNQKDPISRYSGYITPAFLGLPNAQQGEKIRNGPQVGTGATLPLPSRGSPMPSTGEKSERSHKQV